MPRTLHALILLIVCTVMPVLAGEEGGRGPVRFSFVGDLMCHRPQLQAAYNSGTKAYDFSKVLLPVRPLLERADFVIGNLETTLPGNPRQYRGFPLFGVADSYAEALKAAGIDILTTANNHCCDSFRDGLIRTVEVVQRLGFQQTGTWKSKEDFEMRRVLLLERNGLKVAVLNFTYGTNGIKVPEDVVVNLMTQERVTEELAYARSLKPDATIVVYHWGWEYNRYPNAQQKQFAQLSFEHGADVVLGAHPHVVQPYEMRTVKDIYGETRDCLVLYSAGNFLSNMQRAHTKGGIVFHFDLAKTSEGRLIFGNVDHTVSWVYRGYAGGRRSYQVVRADGKDGAVSMPAYERSRMRSHLSATDALLAKGRKSVANYYQRLDEPLPAPEPVVVRTLPKKPAPAEAAPAAEVKVDPVVAENFRPTGTVVLTARLLARPAADQVDTAAGNTLGIFEYAVESVQSGDYPLKKIRVADGLVVGGRLTRLARRDAGAVVELGVVPLENYPALKRWRVVDVETPDTSLPVFTPKL